MTDLNLVRVTDAVEKVLAEARDMVRHLDDECEKLTAEVAQLTDERDDARTKIGLLRAVIADLRTEAVLGSKAERDKLIAERDEAVADHAAVLGELNRLRSTNTTVERDKVLAAWRADRERLQTQLKVAARDVACLRQERDALRAKVARLEHHINVWDER